MAGVQITGLIKPLNNGSFPVWEDINGLGGFRCVADIAARNAIPQNFRKVGMVVVVQSDSTPYILIGGTFNFNWQVFTGGNATPILRNTLLVSSTATPASKVFNTIQAAVNSILNNTPTVIILAPETFTENVNVPIGRQIAFTTYEFCGVRAVLNGSLTWNCADTDFLSLSGLSVFSGITQVEGGSAPGSATLRLVNCQTANVSGTPALTSVSLQLGGEIDNDSVILGNLDNNGNVLAENSTCLGTVTAPQIAGIDCNFAADITASDVTLLQCEFLAPLTITYSSNLNLDDYSAFQARANVTFAGAGQAHLSSGLSLAQRDAGTGGATPTFDFKRSGSVLFSLDQNTTPTFVAPPYSQLLTLMLEQTGAAHWTFTWPGNVVNPPVIGATGESTYLMFYCKENNKYYPFKQ
jgi:hypothetical protein